ncbi:PEP-CTERM protein-sorting domain-containing protein [Roseateles sp. YR242]|uniref:PEP-CTERM sorting domain-containing protein n=1 Tax=Roseateles sp. YR242 TaxID=1855305 RepID=UPI0008CF0870|nr:PEP-CTERM sorting domain-containing protein [Roseateles sp. YR242]SEK83745.1 PEP-CTERM protein-sorting domain-containing protein [Roseateles sp. YR242]
MSNTDLHSSGLARLRVWLATLLGLMLLALGGPARAEWYQYTFMSDVFNVHSVSDRAPGTNEWDVPAQLRIEFYSWSQLSGSATESDIISYKISIWGGGPANLLSLSTPLPESGCFPPGGCYEYTGNFNVGSFDANGLPTTWNIWLDRYSQVPIAQEFFNLSSSNTGSSLDLRAYSYYSSIGSVTAQAGELGGVWSLAVVPEPASYVLLLAGVVLVGGMARRRRAA